MNNSVIAAFATHRIVNLLLQEPLLHGDAEHRKWLEEEINKRSASIEIVVSDALWQAQNIRNSSA